MKTPQRIFGISCPALLFVFLLADQATAQGEGGSTASKPANKYYSKQAQIYVQGEQAASPEIRSTLST